MEYRIDVEEHMTQKMIHACISGSMSDMERTAIVAEVFHKCKDNHVIKIIFDVLEAELGYSLTRSHQGALDFANSDMAKDIYWAVIYSRNKEQIEHTATVLHNRGIHNLSFFQNVEEGINWLAGKG